MSGLPGPLGLLTWLEAVGFLRTRAHPAHMHVCVKQFEPQEGLPAETLLSVSFC